MDAELKLYYKKMVTLGIPIVLQNLISIGLNLLDTLMIGMLGEAQLAAVGAANQLFFIYSVSLFGLLSGCAVYTSQYYGADDLVGLRKVVGICYGASLLTGVLVTLAAWFFAPFFVGVFCGDMGNTEVIAYGASYMRISCFSYVFGGISFAIIYNSRAVQRVRATTTISALAIGCNGLLNYLLIFGIGIFPAMGVQGAATATLIARILECGLMLGSIYLVRSHPLRAGIRQLFTFSRDLFSRVMRTALPVIATEGCWALTTAMIFAAYGRIGTSALAVIQVAQVILQLIQTFYFGVGNATAMTIGQSLGMRNVDRAYRFGRQALILTMLINVIGTGVAYVISRPVAAIYGFGGETNELLIATIITLGFLLTPRMLSYMFCVGILRAGGDTFYCMILEIGCNIFVDLPMAYLAVLGFHASLPLALVMVELGNVIRILVCFPRFWSRKWLHVVID